VGVRVLARQVDPPGEPAVEGTRRLDELISRVVEAAAEVMMCSSYRPVRVIDRLEKPAFD